MCRRSASAARSTASTRTRSEAGTITGATIRRNSIISAPRKQRKIRSTPRFFACSAPDPIYNYGLHRYKDEYETPATIEPCTEMGCDPKVMRWFFENYFNNESLAFSYIQLSQENSFGWEGIEKGLPMQFEILDEYVKSGKCSVMTMVDTGE